MSIQEKLAEAVSLRKLNQGEAALQLLKALLPEFPKDPDLHYQLAWTCDSLGRESEAVGFYEAALSLGLTVDREGALLGLGSTYRCLGEYEKSLATFDTALEEFPANRAFPVFRALTLFNLGRSEESVSALLVQLLDTTKDQSILSYEKALRFYSDKLGETWK